VAHEESEDAIREWLGDLAGLDLTDAEVEAAADRLVGIGAPAVPVVLDLYRQEDEALLAVATQALKRWPAPRPTEPLIGLLRDPELDPMAKALLLIVLESYGLDPASPHLVGLTIDLEEFPIHPSRPDGGVRS
jgi:hypothetical protein